MTAANPEPEKTEKPKIVIRRLEKLETTGYVRGCTG